VSIQDGALLPTEYNLDKIVITSTETISVTDTVALKFRDFTSTGVNTNYDFVGIYSYDGGTTWTDLVGQVSSRSGFTAQPDVEIGARIDTAGKVWLNIIQKALLNGGSPWTLTIKLAYLANTDNTTLPNSILNTDKILYDNKYSYMKIAKEGSFTVSSSSAQLTTIAHGLGYVPVCQAYLKRNIGRQRITYGDFGISGSINNAVRIDEDNLYVNTSFYSPTETLTVTYKIYYEEQ